MRGGAGPPDSAGSQTGPQTLHRANWRQFSRLWVDFVTPPRIWNSVPDVQNVVPAVPDEVEEALADRAVADRRAAYAAEARRLIDAAFVVMRRDGQHRSAGARDRAGSRPLEPGLLPPLRVEGRAPPRGARRRAAPARRVPARAGSRTASIPAEQVQRWIGGVMAQARDRDAAEATRPFACNGARLADLFPADLAASRAELLDVARAGGARARRHRRTTPSSSATSRSRA